MEDCGRNDGGSNPRPFEWQSNVLAKLNYIPMEAIFRIELKTKGYKALVLPLNYIAI